VTVEAAFRRVDARMGREHVVEGAGITGFGHERARAYNVTLLKRSR